MNLYQRAQQTVKNRGTCGDTGKAPRCDSRPYLFRGLITCGLCGRTMVGSTNHGRLYYRCTASRDFVGQHQITHPPAVYVREDVIIAVIDRFLGEELTGNNLAGTLRRVAEGQYQAALHDRASDMGRRRAVGESGGRSYGRRAALEAGGGPAHTGGWRAETTAIHTPARRRQDGVRTPAQPPADGQIDAIATAYGKLLGRLQHAEPHHKADLYSRLGLRMTHRPGPHTINLEIAPSDLEFAI
jgi:site-specific DNA recombinase